MVLVEGSNDGGGKAGRNNNPIGICAIISQKAMAAGPSLTESIRVQMRVTDINTTAPSSAAVSMRQRSPEGCNMISTPPKPIMVEVQRRQPTFSPSSGMANSVINNGVAQATA